MITSRRKKEISDIASNTRKLCRISTHGINDIFEACEELGIYYIRYPLEEGVLGASIRKDDVYIIFSNSSVVYSREIFSVAHEIGHIELGHLNTKENTIQLHTEYYDSEADYFAACFLMPKEDIFSSIEELEISQYSIIDIVRLQSVFNTSFDATVNRLNALGKINDNKVEELKNQKKENSLSIILRSIGNDASLCYKSNTKSISRDYLKWIQFNYSKKLISKKTAEKALGYLDIPFDVVDFHEETPTSSFDFDAFWEDDSE